MIWSLLKSQYSSALTTLCGTWYRRKFARQGHRRINRRGNATVKADLKKEGDLGLVAMACYSIASKSQLGTHDSAIQNSKNNQKTLFKPKALTLPFVFSNLRDIALSSGHSVCGRLSLQLQSKTRFLQSQAKTLRSALPIRSFPFLDCG